MMDDQAAVLKGEHASKWLEGIKELTRQTAEWFVNRPEDWCIPPKKDVMEEWAKFFDIKIEDAPRWWCHISLCIGHSPYLLKSLEKPLAEYFEKSSRSDHGQAIS